MFSSSQVGIGVCVRQRFSLFAPSVPKFISLPVNKVYKYDWIRTTKRQRLFTIYPVVSNRLYIGNYWCRVLIGFIDGVVALVVVQSPLLHQISHWEN